MENENKELETQETEVAEVEKKGFFKSAGEWCKNTYTKAKNSPKTNFVVGAMTGLVVGGAAVMGMVKAINNLDYESDDVDDSDVTDDINESEDNEDE